VLWLSGEKGTGLHELRAAILNLLEAG